MHTPGPWIIHKPQRNFVPGQKDDRLICDEEESHIAEVFQYQSDENQDGPSIANAHLISAAPDMLEALEHLVACEALHLSVENNIREIIRKAKGD